VSSNGVLHLQGGGFPETEGTKIPGIDTRADVTFRIAFVLTLIGMRFTPDGKPKSSERLTAIQFPLRRSQTQWGACATARACAAMHQV